MGASSAELIRAANDEAAAPRARRRVGARKGAAAWLVEIQKSRFRGFLFAFRSRWRMGLMR